MKKVLGSIVLTLTVFIGTIYIVDNTKNSNNHTTGIVTPFSNEDHPEY